VEKLSNGWMELIFVPAGATGKYQVNDTHLHKPLKDYARKLTDEQVGSSSQSAVTQTYVDKNEMEDVVDGEENVEYEEEVVRNDDDKEEEEEDVLDENEEKEGDEDEDEDGEKVEEEVLEEGEEEGEEEEEESDVVRELHPSHSQTSRLFTSSLSLGVPVPRATQCIRDV
jgi:hypothetical protein